LLVSNIGGLREAGFMPIAANALVLAQFFQAGAQLPFAQE
jgi:hypothetical protein